jgi:hypothetical protein
LFRNEFENSGEAKAGGILERNTKRGMELLHKNESLALFYVRTCGD